MTYSKKAIQLVPEWELLDLAQKIALELKERQDREDAVRQRARDEWGAK